MEGIIKLVDRIGEVVSFKVFNNSETKVLWEKKWKKRYPNITDKNIIVEYAQKEKYTKPKVDHKKQLGGSTGRKVPMKPHLDHVLTAKFYQNK